MTILGTYILVSLAFVSIAMMEFAFIILLNRRTMMKINTQEDKEKAKRKVKKSFRMANTKRKLKANHDKTSKQGGKISVSVPPVHIVDFVAFWIHFSAFLLFNLFYWNTYLE